MHVHSVQEDQGHGALGPNVKLVLIFSLYLGHTLSEVYLYTQLTCVRGLGLGLRGG